MDTSAALRDLFLNRKFYLVSLSACIGNLPDLDSALTDAIIDAFGAYTSMSKQALDSERVRAGLMVIPLGPAQLYEALRAHGGEA